MPADKVAKPISKTVRAMGGKRVKNFRPSKIVRLPTKLAREVADRHQTRAITDGARVTRQNNLTLQDTLKLEMVTIEKYTQTEE